VRSRGPQRALLHESFPSFSSGETVSWPMLLDEQIVAIEQAFVEGGIRHAFGGAQALAYYGSVRA
jgi:hypothetical protein